jgi:protein-S-isoprenylcysteine O-methyltransferase Ste14
MAEKSLKARFLPFIVFGVLAVVIAVLVWVTRLAGVQDLHALMGVIPYGVMQVVGIVLIVLAAPVFVASVRTIGPETAAGHGVELVDRGIYRYSRNPMYYGLHVTVLGFGLLLNSTAVALAGVLAIVMGMITAKREEPVLLEQYGEPYRAYKERTPFYVPNYAHMLRDAGSRSTPQAQAQ